MTTWVTLEEHELLYAAMGGCQRRIKAMRKGRQQYHGADDREDRLWQLDVIGALGECGVAKALRLYWTPATDRPLTSLEGDVSHVQVRSTSYKTGHMLVYEYDDDDAPFVFCIVKEPWVKIVGWLYGKEAKQLGEARDSGTSVTYWVKQEMLRPLWELAPIIEGDGVRCVGKPGSPD